MKKIILISFISTILSAETFYVCTPFKKNFGEKTYLYKERQKIKFNEDLNGTYLIEGVNVYELVETSKFAKTYENEDSMILIPLKSKDKFLEIVKIPLITKKKIYTTYFCAKDSK